MDKEPLTRQQINQFKRRFIWVVLLIAASLMLLFSCSPSLYRPTNGNMITWVCEDYIYTGTYLEPKKDSIPNHWGVSYCVGDVVYEY